MSNIIGRRLTLMLSNLNLTQKELAINSGLTEAAISRYIKGVRIPNAASLIAIVDATGISSNWILGYGKDDVMERM